MHVASANPQAIDPSGLDPAAVEREKNVLADKFKAQGKPAAMIEKIVESGLKTYYKEVCLARTALYFRREGQTERGASGQKKPRRKPARRIKITGFKRFALGEGIERPAGDFGGEVAALAGTH